MNTKDTSPAEITLGAIEGAAKAYAAERDELGRLVKALNDQLAYIKATCLTGIKRAVAKAADRESALRGLVEQAPGLFFKPRTLVLHGIRVGWEKGKGRITFDDPDRVVELIGKQFPELADSLVITKRSPDKKALAELPAALLKRLGISLEDADDHVVIRAVDSDVDRIVNALLKEASTENN